jgi:RsiW-degrading membrane proteinase PrsW (M82 family)
MDDQTIKRMSQFLTTEHAALQNARNARVVESNGRTASFLTTISASFVALALISQISRFSEVFLLFALVLIPTLAFIGISAYVRMVQLDFSEFVYTAAINRIRRFYLQTTPEIGQYISFPAFDDQYGVLRSQVIYTSFPWTVLSLPSSLILVINSLLAGALCSILVIVFFQPQVFVAVGAGVFVFLLAAVLQYLLGLKWYADLSEEYKTRFPAPGE